MTVSGFINAQNALYDCGVVGNSIINTPTIGLSGLGEACFHIGIWNEWISDPKRPVKRDQS